LEVDDDGAAGEVRDGSVQDFGFGLVPVFLVAAFESSALLVKFGGAAANGLLHLRRIVTGGPRHIETASLPQKGWKVPHKFPGVWSGDLRDLRPNSQGPGGHG
jgi:hypothetical protein